MDRFPVMTLQPHVWAFSQQWTPPVSPPIFSSASPLPTSSGMSPKAKAFSIDALLGLRTQKELPVSPTTSPVSVLWKDSHDAALRDAPGKVKRHRTVFTESQLQRLEEEFDRQQYLVGPARRHLATELNLSDLQLKVWFQNRRIKWRKSHRTSEDLGTCSSSSDSE